MDNSSSAMDRFDFLLGDWTLEYRVPKSPLADADSGTGEGTISRALEGRYVFFDYRVAMKSGGRGAAHGVFGWDENAGIYRYWWFENSGNFLSASARFVADGVLRLNWHDSVLVQSFERMGPDRVVLTMEQPSAGRGYEGLMEVFFDRKRTEGSR